MKESDWCLGSYIGCESLSTTGRRPKLLYGWIIGWTWQTRPYWLSITLRA
ncbi:Uncharacterised protein [Mycobacteroides abscessus subsp. massiliense]|nr:Uncharacterised protein [Mycobacteroides abscessus subsp. massiliense]